MRKSMRLERKRRRHGIIKEGKNGEEELVLVLVLVLLLSTL